MKPVNMLEAKCTLFRLVESVESGRLPGVVIARHGRPVARLVNIDAAVTTPRLGVAKGKFVVPDSSDAHKVEVAALFTGQRR